MSSESLIISVVIVAVVLVVLHLIKKYLIKKVAYTTKDEQHKNTFIGVIFNVLQYIVVIIALIVILKINGYNVTSIVAGLGIFATVVGLALQDSLKDIFNGFNIYSNNFYKVGDVVRYQGELCEVKYFNARITKFRNLYSNSTYTVCNSQINAVEKVKTGHFVKINFAYSEDREAIDRIFNNTIENLKGNPAFLSMGYAGIVDNGGGGVAFGMFYKSDPKEIMAEVYLQEELYRQMKLENVYPFSNYEYQINIKK